MREDGQAVLPMTTELAPRSSTRPAARRVLRTAYLVARRPVSVKRLAIEFPTIRFFRTPRAPITTNIADVRAWLSSR